MVSCEHRDSAVVLLGADPGHWTADRPGAVDRTAQQPQPPRQCDGEAGRPAAQLRSAAGCCLASHRANQQYLGADDRGADRHHGVRLPGVADAARRSQRHVVPGGAGGQLAAPTAVDLPRRGPIRDHRPRRSPDLLPGMGCQCRQAVHRIGHRLDRARPDPAELRRSDHLRAVAALRATVQVGRLGGNQYPEYSRCPWPGDRGELARNPDRHRQRHADHSQLGIGGGLVREFEQTDRQLQLGGGVNLQLRRRTR